MAQFSVVISDEEFKLLTELAQQTGRSNSSLAAEWIRRGLYEEIENQNKAEVWRSLREKRRIREQSAESNEEPKE